MKFDVEANQNIKFNLHSNTDPVGSSPTRVVKTDRCYWPAVPAKAETDRVVIVADVAVVANTDYAYAVAATGQDAEFAQKPVATLAGAEIRAAAVAPVTLATEIVTSDRRQHRHQQ